MLRTEGMTYWDNAVSRVIQLAYFVSLLTAAPRPVAYRRVGRGAHLLSGDWCENRTTMRGTCPPPPKTAFDYLRHVRNEQLHWSVAFAIVCLPTVIGEPVNGFRWHLVTDNFTDIPEHVQTSTNPDKRNGNFTWRPSGGSCAHLMNNF